MNNHSKESMNGEMFVGEIESTRIKTDQYQEEIQLPGPNYLRVRDDCHPGDHLSK